MYSIKSYGLLPVVFLLVVGMLVSGCGDDQNTTAETKTTGTSTMDDLEQAYQDDVQALKDSVKAFDDASTYTSVDSIQSAFQDIEDNFDNAVESGKQVKDAKISSVQDSFNDLKTTVKGISSSDQSLAQKVESVKTAVQNFTEQLKQI